LLPNNALQGTPPKAGVTTHGQGLARHDH